MTQPRAPVRVTVTRAQSPARAAADIAVPAGMPLTIWAFVLGCARRLPARTVLAASAVLGRADAACGRAATTSSIVKVTRKKRSLKIIGPINLS